MAESAGSVSVELIAKTESFNREIAGSATVTEQAMGRIINATSKGEQQVVRSAGQIANGTRNFGRQLADIGAQASGGQSPFLIFAQQAPQLAEAVEDMGGRAARVAAFFTGPFGAALLAAGSIIGVLATEALKTGDSIEDLVEKLGKEARQAQQNEAAHYQFSQTTAGLTISIRDLSKALDQENASSQRATFLTLAKAQADREASVQARKRAASTLALAVALAQNAKAQNIFAGGPGGAQSLVSAQYGAEEARARSELAQATKNVAAAERDVVKAQAPIIRNQVAEAHDAAARAAGRYDRQLDLLYAKLRRGTITEAQYRQGVERATTQRDTALEADRASNRRGRAAPRRVDVRISASRDAQQGLEAEDKAAADLTRRYEQLQARYDPAAAAAREFRQVMDDIADLRLSGTISEGEALRLQIAAIGVEAKRASDELDKMTKDILGDPAKEVDDILAGITAARDAKLDEQDKLDEAMKQKRERDIDDLAYFYESAFNGGVGSIWDTFKREGFRAIALVLARLTLGESLSSALGAAKGEGTVGSLIAAAGSFFGRASGGYVAPGQTVRVNENRGGMELLRMGSQGGTIIPLGQASAAARQPNTTIVHAPQFNLRGAVITTELYRDMQLISNESAAAAGQAAYRQSMRDAPGAVSRANRFGTS